jgi:hypothetical protein
MKEEIEAAHIMSLLRRQLPLLDLISRRNEKKKAFVVELQKIIRFYRRRGLLVV